MSRLRRLAVGTLQPAADGQAMTWALLEALTRTGRRVQAFSSQACLSRLNGAGAITGRSVRHLDSWLTPMELCRWMFLRSSQDSDLAVVDGHFRSGTKELTAQGSDLQTLCNWLELPPLGIIDVNQLRQCQLPARPPHLQAILLDQVQNASELAYWQTTLQSLWGVPVLGALEALPAARRALAAMTPGSSPPASLCKALGDSFVSLSNLEKLHQLSAWHECQQGAVDLDDCGCPELPMLRNRNFSHLTVAVAYDEAFHGYFPDTLDLLECAGVKLNYFSPLRDESLPPGTDIVYLGCGHPELYAAELSANFCMHMALRDHARQGRRIYAEGGGLAYLCRSLELPGGRSMPMAGLLPTMVRLSDEFQSPVPVEITLSRSTWLAPLGRRLRGYLNPMWQFSSAVELSGCVAETAHHCDMVTSRRALGSRLHLNFALLPEVFRNFCQPSCALACP